MKVTFVSNYINHHQLPFCLAMEAMKDEVNFAFIQTKPMEEKRTQMGWGLDVSQYSFVKLFYQDKEECEKLILESDVTIFGWSDGMLLSLEEQRFNEGKLSFRVSERIYREGQWKFISPKGLIRKYHEHIKYRKSPVYLLCAGAYVASDFNLIHAYPGKRLKWGYFPEGDDSSFKEKELSNKIKLCWAGRFVALKHPEFVIGLAKILKENGYNFEIEMIGDGNLRQELDVLVKAAGVDDVISFTGNLKPAEVRQHMGASDIFLFTSNYLEGWGAVVNEAMLEGCAVVASKEAGAVPFLIQDGVNGLSYQNGSYTDFQQKVLYLFENRDKIHEFGKAARNTILDKWNAENAAKELVRFCKEYYANGNPRPSADGPMSVAECIKPAGLLRSLKEKSRLE
ncbi:glycosyltransferase family 4 protein [Butyrivibrio proteoclasticus]|uniref:glycosyltransferase family 4 protein n=1 Tax=Butyrivibrio proteoclasticus TaxID=43305 RepID=UPI000685A7C8|nr:glycosyltransferase family 4 protein [Butyrivibrio proteoclasticus]